MTAIYEPEPLRQPITSGRAEPTPRKESHNLLFVVHRYAPFQGGSENYVQNMAEEARSRGHAVAVFAGEHKGDLNGVHVTSDPKILQKKWDLIIVHGGDVAIQNYVLNQADRLGGPVLYLLILPSHSPICVSALHRATYIGCSTLADWRHVRDYHAQDRAVRVRHGINAKNSVGVRGFRQKYGITTPYMFLSSGGYWPNKAFDELVGVFQDAKRTDATLVLTGYDNRFGIMPPDTENIRSFLFEDRQEMLNALTDADLYILNSYSEGFGLVLLESMLNLTAWVGRGIAGAELMREFGATYATPQELQTYLQLYRTTPETTLFEAQKYVLSTHLVRHTVDDILKVIRQ